MGPHYLLLITVVGPFLLFIYFNWTEHELATYPLFLDGVRVSLRVGLSLLSFLQLLDGRASLLKLYV
jgi:hypothetical protein